MSPTTATEDTRCSNVLGLRTVDSTSVASLASGRIVHVANCRYLVYSAVDFSGFFASLSDTTLHRKSEIWHRKVDVNCFTYGRV